MSASTITEAIQQLTPTPVVAPSQPLEIIRIKNGVHELTNELVTIATLAEMVLGVVSAGDPAHEDLVEIEGAARQAIGKLTALRVQTRERPIQHSIPMLRLVEDG
jgi:hypothetical protein